MKRYISLLFVALVLAFVGCQDPIDDYYGGLNESSNAIPTQSIMEILSESEDGLYFIDLLTASGVIDTLDERYLYTVLLPTKDAMDAAGIANMSIDSMKMFVKMLMVSNPQYTTNFSAMSSTRMLNFADKYLTITMDSVTMDYLLDGVVITESDVRCTDGVIHRLEDILLPRYSLYEWLELLGSDYSMFRDSLITRTIYTFDLESSILVGETTMGQPIYDSVYISSNDILDMGDIQDERGQYRMIVPSNNAILTAFDNMADTYITRGMSVSTADSVEWMNWFLQAAIYDYSETGVDSFDGLSADYSVFDLEFRPATVSLDEPIRLSNGFAYTSQQTYLPAYIPMDTIIVNPGTIRATQNGSTSANYSTHNGTWDTWSTNGQYTLTAAQWSYIDGAYTTVQLSQQATGTGAWAWNMPNKSDSFTYSFKSCYRDPDDAVSTKTLNEWIVVPGQYKFQVCFYQNPNSGLVDYLDIYLNDEYMGYVSGFKDRAYVAGEEPVMMDITGCPEYIYIGDSAKMATFKIGLTQPTYWPDGFWATEYTDSYAELGYYLSYQYNKFRVGDFVLTPYDNY